MDNSEFIKIARKAIKERLSLGDLITKLVNLIDEMEKAENFSKIYSICTLCTIQKRLIFYPFSF